jgi:hypothetical protein
MRRWFTVAVIALSALATSAETAKRFDGYETFVADDGSFRFAGSDSLRGLAHLGSWFVPEGDAAGLHHVYTQPGAAEHYRATGRFADGTVLVKEVVRARRDDYTTGADVARATEVAQWFVMVKDAEGRFEDDPLWGDGWGWALFRGDAPARNVATDRRADCLGCHAPARASDWVYVEGYPVLRAPEPSGAAGAGPGSP